jgi:hypothetical protein
MEWSEMVDFGDTGGILCIWRENDVFDPDKNM